jgi:DNA-binding LytR/AlgR family response regulator
MTKLNCLVVEDEPLAQNVLKQYIQHHPSLQLAGIANDAFQAQHVLMNTSIELIFLDINLPGLSGINFLKSLPHPPAVIFTTAYTDFALEGFELDAVDYLVKPFSFERFLKAVNKMMKLALRTNTADTTESIFVKADKKLIQLQVSNIIDIEALGDYVKLRLTSGQQMVNSTLKDLLEELPKDKFLRIHKSYAVALNKIEFIEGNYMRIAGKDLPIGATYKEQVAKLFTKR